MWIEKFSGLPRKPMPVINTNGNAVRGTCNSLCMKTNVEFIKNQLKTGNFWCCHAVSKTVGDGHCFLYSVIDSHNKQHPCRQNLHLDDLKQLIVSEVENYSNRYIAGTIGRCRNRLFHGLTRYIEFKEYDTNFGDLVSIITSNALALNVLIIEDSDGNMKTEAIPDKLSYSTTICVKKSNDHYEAIYPRASSHGGFSMFNNISDMIKSTRWGSSLNHSLATTGSTNVLNDSPAISTRVKTDFVPPTRPACTTHCLRIDHIRFCFWNINGLTATKLSDCVLGGFLKSFHVIMLCETWSDGSKCYELEGFNYYDFPKKNRHKKCKEGIRWTWSLHK